MYPLALFLCYTYVQPSWISFGFSLIESMNLICVEEEEGAGARTGAGTGVAEDEAVAIDDVKKGVVDGAGTRLGITGSGFTETEERAGVNGGVPFRMLLATTR